MSDNKIKVDLKTFAGEPMYSRYIKESSPSVCVTGCFDITNLIKLKKKGHSLNALICYCIQEAGQKIEEFHYSIQKDGLYYYKNVKTNSVIKAKDNQLYFPDYKYNVDFKEYEKEYHRVNNYCINNCTHFIEDTGAVLSTSAMINYPFTSFSLDNTSDFWDNFLMWGKYQKKFFKYYLNISLRFHHATIDGEHAGIFFKELQHQFSTIKID